MSPLLTHQRQVHLDFHTSPFIPGVAADFDAAAFAETFRRARVNSVTIFAKCHHGFAYYPSKVCEPHPQLVPAGRDLLGEQIEALHRAGIRAPIYITVGWDERLTQLHPEWRAMAKNGFYAGTPIVNPGQWRFVNWLHPEVQNHIEALTREVLERYGREVDGFFYDIVFFPPNACWSEESMKFREARGLLEDSPAGFARFHAAAQEAFCSRLERVARGQRPEITVFFNSTSETFFSPSLGIRARLPFMTHMEIESLPSGFWGYFHFPRTARAAMRWGKPWLGMTGRFQTMWGDFGGIKPQAALEFECFRSQALGGANSVGDQLLPRGILDPAAYDLIGAVYERVESAEPFYAGSEPIPQVGITCAGAPSLDPNETSKSDEGAVQMCEETHYDCAMLEEDSRLEGLDLVILNDTTPLTPAFADKLRTYYEQGGRLLISHRGGCDEAGRWLLGFLPVRVLGEAAEAPSYWRVAPSFCPSLARGDRVVYQRGLRLEAGPGSEVLAERVRPYFERNDALYCSHLQTPPRPEPSGEPAILAGERFVLFAEPIFREYRQSGNLAVRDAWRAAMQRLIGPPPFGNGLPTTVQVYPRRRGQDLLLTLLHYVPVRKALNVDVIEERGVLGGEILRLPPAAQQVRVFGGPELEKESAGGFLLPAGTRGRLLLEVPGFFAS